MTWETYITKIAPDEIVISGYRIQDIIGSKDFLDTSYLAIKKEFPSIKEKRKIETVFREAISYSPPHTDKWKNEELSKTVARYILSDKYLNIKYSEEEKTAFFIGRMLVYIADIFSTVDILQTGTSESFSDLLYRAITGKRNVKEEYARMLEAMMVASVDHGVTPPSAQATIIAASTRASYEVAIANGVSAITDVHGGAGMMAASFFKECIHKASSENLSVIEATKRLIEKYISEGKRIKGLGHRIHKNDPRKKALFEIAYKYEINGEAIKIAEEIENIFRQIKGKSLPLNVDGAIGAIIVDMGFDPIIAKLLFIYGRIAGLSAHYLEEINTQPPMRRINFAEAIYNGKGPRNIL